MTIEIGPRSNFKNLQVGLETKNKSLSIMETGP
jgi:hypothetical protein